MRLEARCRRRPTLRNRPSSAAGGEVDVLRKGVRDVQARCRARRAAPRPRRSPRLDLGRPRASQSSVSAPLRRTRRCRPAGPASTGMRSGAGRRCRSPGGATSASSGAARAAVAGQLLEAPAGPIAKTLPAAGLPGAGTAGHREQAEPERARGVEGERAVRDRALGQGGKSTPTTPIVKTDEYRAAYTSVITARTPPSRRGRWPPPGRPPCSPSPGTRRRNGVGDDPPARLNEAARPSRIVRMAMQVSMSPVKPK